MKSGGQRIGQSDGLLRNSEAFLHVKIFPATQLKKAPNGKENDWFRRTRVCTSNMGIKTIVPCYHFL